MAGISGVLGGLGGANGKGLAGAPDDVAGLQHLLEAAQRQQATPDDGAKGNNGEPPAKRFCTGGPSSQATQAQA